MIHTPSLYRGVVIVAAVTALSGCPAQRETGRYDRLLTASAQVRQDELRGYSAEAQVEAWMYAWRTRHPPLDLGPDLSAAPESLFSALVAGAAAGRFTRQHEQATRLGTWLLCRSDAIVHDTQSTRRFATWVRGLSDDRWIRSHRTAIENVLNGRCRCRYPESPTCLPGVTLVTQAVGSGGSVSAVEQVLRSVAVNYRKEHFVATARPRRRGFPSRRARIPPASTMGVLRDARSSVQIQETFCSASGSFGLARGSLPAAAGEPLQV